MNIFRKTAIAASIYLIGTATFAGSVDANVNVFGASSALTINATVTPTNDFVSNNSKLYLAIVQGADVYFYSDTAGFVPYAGGLGALTGSNPAEAPPVRSITKGAESITLTGDARGVKGADVYVGYGASFAELISSARYTKLYTMITRPEDLTLKCITDYSQSTGSWNAPFINKAVSPNYDFEINAWNSKGLVGWQECAAATIASDASNVTARWTWDYGANPLEPQWPKAAPTIGYGRYPGNTDVSPNMPTQIGTTSTMAVNWDITLSTTGTTNLMLEAWISSDGKSPSLVDPKNTTHTNMAVWFNATGKYSRWHEWHRYEVVTIAGKEYEFYYQLPVQKIETSPGVFVDGFKQSLLYIAKVPQFKGTVNYMDFVNHSKSRGLLKDTDFIEYIDFGTEIGDGVGELRVNSYNVTVH